MIYFDTDVLVHYFVIQDLRKHLLAKKLYEDACLEGAFFISLLTLQETAFVLSKLKMTGDEIAIKLSVFNVLSSVNYSFDEYLRASELCQKVGFHNINDCLHTAIAETYCQQIHTFNQDDFKKIQKYTALEISIL